MIKGYETFGRHCLIYETCNAAIGKCLLKCVLSAGGGAVQGGLVDFACGLKRGCFLCVYCINSVFLAMIGVQ